MLVLGVVTRVTPGGVFVALPGSQGSERGPYETLARVAVSDRVALQQTQAGDFVVLGPLSAEAPLIGAADIANGAVTSAKILDGTIVDADVSASAALSRSKISGLPTSSTDNRVVRFDGTAGAMQSSPVGVEDTGRVTGLVDPTSSTDAATKGYADARMPTGSVTAYAGASAPTGWLLCAGQAVSRTTYADLYALIGTTYGTGDGSTTFNLPDLRGRTVAGLDNMDGTDAGRLDWANTRGTAGGAQAHTLSAAESGVPAHSHGITDPGHSHGLYMSGGSGGSFPVSFVSGSLTPAFAVTVSATTGVTVNNNTAAAASSAHNNMQPTLLLNWIIRT